MRKASNRGNGVNADKGGIDTTSPGNEPRPPIEDQLGALTSMPLDALRKEWRRRWRSDPPAIRSRDVLMRMIGWKIQVAAFGGYSRDVRRRLDQLIADGGKGLRELAPAARLKPGTVLTREWKGNVHRVQVEAVGFRYDGRIFDSLSEIARAITGARWSGPRFFGLEEARSRPATGTVEPTIRPPRRAAEAINDMAGGWQSGVAPAVGGGTR